jgi:hypothetical protein
MMRFLCRVVEKSLLNTACGRFPLFRKFRYLVVAVKFSVAAAGFCPRIHPGEHHDQLTSASLPKEFMAALETKKISCLRSAQVALFGDDLLLVT